MPSIAETQVEISSCLRELDGMIVRQARISDRASLAVKFGLVGLGSMFATIAQFMTFGPTGPTGWQMGGIVASVMVAIGAGFTVLTDKDTAGFMASARKSATIATELFSGNSVIIESLNRATNTHMAMRLMRLALQRAATNSAAKENVFETMFDLARQRIPLAIGVREGDQWTLCVYKAVRQEDGQYLLELVAHERAIKCEIADARKWPSGVGPGGIAFASKREVVVPDMHAYEIGSALTLGNNERSHDRSRYRSIIAVPIKLESEDSPWGVVVATNNKANHFPLDGADGFKTTEFVRSFANLAALAVAITERP